MFGKKNRASSTSPSNASSTSSATPPQVLSTRLERQHQEATQKLAKADGLYKQLQELTDTVKRELQSVEDIYNKLPSVRVTQSIDTLTPILEKYTEQEKDANEKKHKINTLYEHIKQTRQSIQTILDECKQIETDSNSAFTEATSTLQDLQTIAHTTKQRSEKAEKKIMQQIELEKETQASLSSANKARIQTSRRQKQDKDALQLRARTLFEQCQTLKEYFYNQSQSGTSYVYNTFSFPQTAEDVVDTLRIGEELKIVLAIAEAEKKKRLQLMPTQFEKLLFDHSTTPSPPDYLKTEFQQMVKSIPIPIQDLKYETKSMTDIAQLLSAADSKWNSSTRTCQQYFNDAQQQLTAFIDAYETLRLSFKEEKVEMLYPLSEVHQQYSILPISSPFGDCIFLTRSNEVYCYLQSNGTNLWQCTEMCKPDKVYGYINYSEKKVYTYDPNKRISTECDYHNPSTLFDTESARYYTILRLVESGVVISSQIPENVRFTARNEYNRNEDHWLKKHGSSDYFRQLISYVGNPKKKPWDALTVPLQCESTNVPGMENDVTITFSKEGIRQLKVIITNTSSGNTRHFTLAGLFKSGKVPLARTDRTPKIHSATFDTITLDDIQIDTNTRLKNKDKESLIKFTFNNSLETYAFYLALTKGHSDKISCDGDEDAFKQALKKRMGGRRTPTRRAPHAGLARSTRRRQKRVNVRKRRNRSGTHKKAINRGHGKVFTRRRYSRL